MSDVLCKTCSKWVDCKNDDNVSLGFCLSEELFTFTERESCENYSEGKPMTEEEFDNP